MGLRETTFKINKQIKKEKESQLKQYQRDLKKIFNRKKLRQTCIAGIPCKYVNKNFSMEIGKRSQVANNEEIKEEQVEEK